MENSPLCAHQTYNLVIHVAVLQRTAKNVPKCKNVRAERLSLLNFSCTCAFVNAWEKKKSGEWSLCDGELMRTASAEIPRIR